jgi:DNA polymerase-1
MATKKDQKTLVLLDSHAIIHRAYHALPEFSNSKGEPTGALYGLATMLMKIVGELKPDYIIACYDLPKPTFRHEAYDAYKAGRAKTDDALIAQLIRSRDMFGALSIPIYDMEGFEADDMLGTIVEEVNKFKKDKPNIIIASGDMDTLQLVRGDVVKVYTLKKGIQDTILYDEEAVMSRFGFAPKFLPDYKGLRGDPSDNIIGIKGIGEKTATTLIVEFGTIENLYKELKKKDAEAKFKTLGITERIFNLLKDGEDEALFSKTLATIRRDAPIKFKIPEKIWRETVDEKSVENLMRDLEFKSLVERFKRVLNGESVSVAIKKEEKEKREEPKIEYDKEKMKKLQIAFWLLNSEMTNPTPEDVMTYRNLETFEEVEKAILSDIKNAHLEYVLDSIEMPIVPIIEGMEKWGIKVDVKYLDKLSKEYHTELDKLEKSIWKHAGQEFNINSPKQLGDILFDKLGLTAKGLKKSAGGARSTRESELEKLIDLHPIVAEIFKYRELQKLLSTYIDTIPKLVSKDGRLHAEFIQAGSTTGRFSCANPNLQNIPTKSELGKNIRFAFVADKGHVLASFDYSQIELRIAALLSQDEYFINVFKEDRDIHAAVASRVFHVEPEDVTAEMRRRAKVINFGILYGMGVTALRQNLGGERKDAQIFYDNYFAQFPTIAEYLENVKKFALSHGYTETLFGRRRYFPGIKSPVQFIKAMAERMAINAPIQGTATADVIKIGMKVAHEELEKKGLLSKVHLVLQVHDELVYEIEEKSLKEACTIIQNAMKDAIPAEFLENLEPVPLEVSTGVGRSWGELK